MGKSEGFFHGAVILSQVPSADSRRLSDCFSPRQLVPLGHIGEAITAWPTKHVAAPHVEPSHVAMQQARPVTGSSHRVSFRSLKCPKPTRGTQLSVKSLRGLDPEIPAEFSQTLSKPGVVEDGELLLEDPVVLIEGHLQGGSRVSLRREGEKRSAEPAHPKATVNIQGGANRSRLHHQGSKKAEKTKHRGGLLEQLFSGAFAGVISRTAVAPLDLIRTHLITAHGTQYAGKSAVQLAGHILQRDGWKGFFRGNGINCIRVAPNKAIELCVFESLKRVLGGQGNPFQPIAAPLAGGAAGMAGTLATYPLELMRTRISVQPELYHGFRSTLDKIVKEEGVGALYRGLTPSILGVFPYAATNYFVYDALRSAYRKASGEENVPTVPTLCFGAVAAAASSAVTFPLEVARRQLQLGGPQKSFWGVVANIYKQEGFYAIYRGLGTTWLKLVPAAGISFVCYEAARVALRVDDASFARAARQEKKDKVTAVQQERSKMVREGSLKLAWDEEADCQDTEEGVLVEVPSGAAG